MNVTETSAEGLKREFKITIPASEVEEQITKTARRNRADGEDSRFPAGKGAQPLLRKRYGAAVRGEVLESAVQDSSAKAIRDRNLRPALPPRYELVSAMRGAISNTRCRSRCCRTCRRLILARSASKSWS